MGVATVPTGYPPGWQWDYDGETERSFYVHTPTGVRQYHFPKAGDELELAAALTRSKPDKETASSSTKAPLPTNAKVGQQRQQQQPGNQVATPASNIKRQIASTAPHISSAAPKQNPGPLRHQSVTQHEAATLQSPSRQQNISNAPNPTFPLAQQNVEPAIQQPPFQQANQTSVVLRQNISRPNPTGQQIPIDVNGRSHAVNTSPAPSISNRPLSLASSRGSAQSPIGHNASYFSDRIQQTGSPSIPIVATPPPIPPKVHKPAHGKQFQTSNSPSFVRYNNADEVLSARLRILSLPDRDRENMMRNLRNLARIYPDVTFLQFVNPYIDLPLANQSDLPNVDIPPGKPLHSSASSVHESPRRSSESVLEQHYDAILERTSSISRDSRVPISQTITSAHPRAYSISEEPLPPRRTQTSPPAVGASPGASAPSFGTALDFETSYHSTHNLQPTIQVPLGLAQATVVDLKQQGSVGAQTLSELPVGMQQAELDCDPITGISGGAQTLCELPVGLQQAALDFDPMIGISVVQESISPRDMSTMGVATAPIQHQESSLHNNQLQTANSQSRSTGASRPENKSRESWQKTILEANELRVQSNRSIEPQQLEMRPPVITRQMGQKSLSRKPLAKQIPNQPVLNRLTSSQSYNQPSSPQSLPYPLAKQEPQSLSTFPHNTTQQGSSTIPAPSSNRHVVRSQSPISSQQSPVSRPGIVSGASTQSLSDQIHQRQPSLPSISMHTPSPQPWQQTIEGRPPLSQDSSNLNHPSQASNDSPKQQSQIGGPPNQASIHLHQQAQEKVENDRQEFDRLNGIIKEQNQQLLVLYNQNLQNMQNLQSQQNVVATKQSGQHSQAIGGQPHMNTQQQYIQGSVQLEASSGQVQSAPNLHRVSTAPVTPSGSLMNSLQHTQSMPSTKIKAVASPTTGKPNGVERAIEELKKHPRATAGLIGGFATAAAYAMDVDIEQAVWLSKRFIPTGQIAGNKKRKPMTAANEQNPSQASGFHQAVAKPGSKPSMRLQGADPSAQTQTTQHYVAQDAPSPHTTAISAPVNSLATQKVQDTEQKIQQQQYSQVSNSGAQHHLQQNNQPGRLPQNLTQQNVSQEPNNQPANTQHQNSQLLQNLLKITQLLPLPNDNQGDTAQGNQVVQNQVPEAKYYQEQNIQVRTRSVPNLTLATYLSFLLLQNQDQHVGFEPNLQVYLQPENHQQHIDPAISPPDYTPDLNRINSDPSISDVSPEVFQQQQEYFDPISGSQNSQVDAQEQVHSDSSTSISAEEPMQLGHGDVGGPSLYEQTATQGPPYQENEQDYFIDQSAVDPRADVNIETGNNILIEQNLSVQIDTTDQFARPSQSSSTLQNDGFHTVDTSGGEQPEYFFDVDQSTDVAAGAAEGDVAAQADVDTVAADTSDHDQLQGPQTGPNENSGQGFGEGAVSNQNYNLYQQAGLDDEEVEEDGMMHLQDDDGMDELYEDDNGYDDDGYDDYSDDA